MEDSVSTTIFYEWAEPERKGEDGTFLLAYP